MREHEGVSEKFEENEKRDDDHDEAARDVDSFVEIRSQ